MKLSFHPEPSVRKKFESFFPEDSPFHKLTNESDIRLALMPFVNTLSTKESVSLNGNTVWSRDKIIRDVKRLFKNDFTGSSFTDYLYKFMSLNFTIAHYDKHGWLSVYPNTKAFLKVIDDKLQSIPTWKTDVRTIAHEILYR